MWDHTPKVKLEQFADSLLFRLLDVLESLQAYLLHDGEEKISGGVPKEVDLDFDVKRKVVNDKETLVPLEIADPILGSVNSGGIFGYGDDTHRCALGAFGATTAGP